MAGYRLLYEQDTMKLLRYLNEDTSKDWHHIVNVLKKECSDIIEVYHYAKWVLFRGEGTIIPSGFISKVPRQNRQPQATPQEVHNALNTFFIEKFGWPARNGVFAIGRRGIAMDYGYSYVFFPVNGYKYVYSPEISDLFSQLPAKGQFLKWIDVKKAVYFSEELPKMLKGFYYTDINLVRAVTDGFRDITAPEVMFKCKKYCAITWEHYGFALAKLLAGQT